MKQKIYVAGILIFIITGLFSGCGKKEVDYELDKNGTNGSNNSNLTQFQNAEKWKEDWNVTDKSGTEKSVIVDTDIMIPDIVEMSVIEVERAENAESFRENFMKGFFGENDIYYHDEKHYTKEELERIIVSMEEALANPAYDNESRGELEEMLETEREYFAKASDSYTPAEEFESCDNFLGCRDNILYDALFFDDSIFICPKEEEYYGPKTLTDYDRVYCMTDDNGEYDVSSNECTFSKEDAKEIAERFMMEIGKSSQICTEESQVLWCGEMFDESDNVADMKYVVYGYKFTYCTGINDMVFSQFPNFSSFFDVAAEDNDDSGENYNGDEMTFMVTDMGIVEMEMKAPVNIRNISGSVELLSLDTIKDIIRNELQENGCKYDFTNDRIFDCMQLMYLKVKDDSNEGIFSYVPVWCLSQKWDDANYSHPVFVNAMDGSVIYLNDIT